jgi:iron complex outermembrane receptor protein
VLWQIEEPGLEEDTSIFGELYYKFADRFDLTLGARKYWLRQTIDNVIDGYLNFGPTPSDPQTNKETGIDPKVALSYELDRNASVYASASKGFRAGGAQSSLPFCSLPALSPYDITHLKSDTLWTYELGTKVQLNDPAILVSAAAFRINWDNFQQQVALPCGYFVNVNGNSATIDGGEFEMSGQLFPSLEVRVGLGYEHTDATNPGNLAYAGLNPGARIPGIPAWTATVGGVYSRAIDARRTGFVSADYSYAGGSTTLLNAGDGAIEERPGYSLVNARFGIRWSRSELSLDLRNLTNAKPNLGDVGYNGYAQFGNNSQAGGLIPIVATMQPFTVLVQYKWHL